MSSLYTEQDKNIRQTYLLFTLFFTFVIGIGYFLSYYFNNQFILWFAVLISVIQSFISYWYSDKIALSFSRAIPIKKEDNPYLWNMVENLCITAGLPMPKLYIIPEEQINAFATGRNSQNAAIAVTQGAIKKLENEELEGVLAHELAHIGNKDILVSTIAVVLVGIISIVSDFFFRMTFWQSRRDNRNNNGILMLIGLIFLILAPLAATLIQLAISRKREFLADATGALITRYPDGLANALEKIKNDLTPMIKASDATAHLWISNPFKKEKSWIHKLFMTHPPIEERIAILRGMRI
ncbi:MAG: M48 family metallopeptidase [bacterium]|nr:M48 family metallopeptidase [bacterium]